MAYNPPYQERGPRRGRLIAIIAAVVVLGLIIGFFVYQRGVTSPTTTTSPITTTLPTTPSSTMPGVTTTTRPAEPSAILPSQAAFPAYQHLPYDGDGITIALTGVAPDGKFNLAVYSETLTVGQEHQAYQDFLTLYRDPGTKYLPVFASSLTPAQ
jgi:hypothetical protein